MINKLDEAINTKGVRTDERVRVRVLVRPVGTVLVTYRIRAKHRTPTVAFLLGYVNNQWPKDIRSCNMRRIQEGMLINIHHLPEDAEAWLSCRALFAGKIGDRYALMARQHESPRDSVNVLMHG